MLPSMIASRCSPAAEAITGIPHAIASSGTVANGPAVGGTGAGRLTSTSAERSKAGAAAWVSAPVKVSRSRSPSRRPSRSRAA